MRLFLPALTLLAGSVLNAADSGERISASVTPGGSIRLLQIDKNGSPTLSDKSVGEQSWNRAPSPSETLLPQDATVLGLPNAEVRAFGFTPDGLMEYRASRMINPWVRTAIDARQGSGQPCAVHAGAADYVFAKNADGALIAKRGQFDGWSTISAMESAPRQGQISAVSCGAVSESGIAVVEITSNGTRLLVLDTASSEIQASDLTDENGQAVILSGHASIAAFKGAADVVGATASAALGHWSRAAEATAWRYETVPMTSVSNGSPSAAYFQGQLFVSTLRADGKIGVYQSTPGAGWSETALSAPAGDSFGSDPQLAGQSDEMSLFDVLHSGDVETMTFRDEAWISLSSAKAAGKVVARLSAQTATPQTLTQYIDSLALIPPPPPPSTTSQTPQITYSSQNGINYQNINQTTIHSTDLSVIVTDDPNSDVVWPGSVVQGNSVASGLLAAVGLSRAPLTITITGAAGKGDLSTTIQAPTLSTVTTGIRNLLQNLSVQNATAAVHYDSSTGSSEEDALLNLGISAKFLGQSVKASLSSSSTLKTSTVAIRFAQRYYSLNVGTPPTPASVFASGVAANDAARFMGAGNPPGYLSEVTYGRMLIYIFQSNDSADDLQSALDATFNVVNVGGTIKVSSDAQNKISNSSVQILALGGSASDAIKLISGGDFKTQLNNYLIQGANFSFDSPGAPLSYTVKYLRDGSVMQVNSATQWYTTQSYALPVQNTFYIGLGSQHRDCSTAYQSGIVQTGIYLRPGDQISIQASGQIWSGVFATGFNPPNGWYTWKTPSKGIGFPDEAVSPFSLLYQIGDSQAEGSGGQNPAKSYQLGTYAGHGFPSRTYNGSTGQLELLINSNNFNAGSGCFEVKVSVSRQN